MQESAFEVCNYEDLAALIRWLSVMWFVPYPSGIAITDPIGSRRAYHLYPAERPLFHFRHPPPPKTPPKTVLVKR